MIVNCTCILLSNTNLKVQSVICARHKEEYVFKNHVHDLQQSLFMNPFSLTKIQSACLSALHWGGGGKGY